MTTFINSAEPGFLIKEFARCCDVNGNRAIGIKHTLITAHAALLAEVFPILLVGSINAQYLERVSHKRIISLSGSCLNFAHPKSTGGKVWRMSFVVV